MAVPDGVRFLTRARLSSAALLLAGAAVQTTPLLPSAPAAAPRTVVADALPPHPLLRVAVTRPVVLAPRRPATVRPVAPAPRRTVPVRRSTPVQHVTAPARTDRTVVTETAAQRGARVLASLHYDWRALGYRVQFLPARGGYLGLTVPAQRLIQVYVRSGQSDLVLAHTIAHELGHALDFSRATADRRQRYLALRGLPAGSPWFGCSGCTDYATPAGDWAEVFAYALAGPGDFRSQMAGAPTAAQLTGLRALFGLS